jgi:hypothetical protein
MNHATAQAGFHAAGAATLHSAAVPDPVRLRGQRHRHLGEDARHLRRAMMQQRTGMKYFACDSQDYPGVLGAALEAIEFVRSAASPGVRAH